MRAAFAYEWRRLVSLRSTWWLTGVAVLVGIGLTAVIAFAADVEMGPGGPTAEDRRYLPAALVSQGSAVFVPFLFAYLVAMIGVFGWGHEYRHGMIRATLTAVPSRPAVWAAKFLVVGAWVTAAWLLAGVVSLLLGALVLAGSGLDVVNADSFGMLGRCAVYVVLLTWALMAFTAVVRHQVVALVLMFLWPFVVENVLAGVVSAIGPLRDLLGGVIRFLPFDAGGQMINVVDFGLTDQALGPWEGFVVFLVFTGALMAASLALFQRRDA